MQLKDINGELIYPITQTENVVREDGSTIESTLSSLEDKIGISE